MAEKNGYDIEKENILIVEGEDEKSFFEFLLKKMNLNEDIQILPFGGKDKFPKRIPSLIKRANIQIDLKTIAIVRDADKKIAEDAFKSICNILKKTKSTVPLVVPTKLNEFSNDMPKIGIFVMPDNKNEGMLEDLCLEVFKDSPVMGCVNSFIDCVSKLPTPTKTKSKAKIQSFLMAQPSIATTQILLSAQYKTVNSVGIAAKKGYIDFESAALGEIINFLKKMT